MDAQAIGSASSAKSSPSLDVPDFCAHEVSGTEPQLLRSIGAIFVVE